MAISKIDINEISKINIDAAIKIYDNEGYDHLYDIIQYDNVELLIALVEREIVSEMDLIEIEVDAICQFDSINIFGYVIDIFNNIYPDYDDYVRTSVVKNSTRVFAKLLSMYISNGDNLAFIGRDTLKHSTENISVEMFKTLYKHGARAHQPIIYNYAISYDNGELVKYLDTFYIVRDVLDMDNNYDYVKADDIFRDCCDEYYYGNDMNDRNELLLECRTSNANNIIHTLKRLPLPYELLEKIIIHTGDFYLIMAINQNLAKFMYFPETNFKEADIDIASNIINYNKQRVIKILPVDNLIVDLYEMVITMLYRNNITLFKFLYNIYSKLGIYTEYGRNSFIATSVELGQVEIFEFLINNCEYELDLELTQRVLENAARHNNVKLFKILHQHGVKVKYKSVVDIAYDYESYDLANYLENIECIECPCCNDIIEYDSDD